MHSSTDHQQDHDGRGNQCAALHSPSKWIRRRPRREERICHISKLLSISFIVLGVCSPGVEVDFISVRQWIVTGVSEGGSGV